MKKIVLSLIILCAFVVVSNAQNEKFFRFGVHGNTGLSWMKPDQDSLEYQGMRIGLGWGFIGEMTLADNFSVATGFDVSYMGGKLQKAGVYQSYPPDTTQTLSIENSTYKLQYLDLPISLKMKTNEINYMTYFMRIGGSFGICLNGKADREYTSIGGGSNLSLNDIDLKDTKNFFRANFQIGGGVEYSLGGTTAILGELTFVNGLTYLIEDNKAIGNYLMFKVGILF